MYYVCCMMLYDIWYMMYDNIGVYIYIQDVISVSTYKYQYIYCTCNMIYDLYVWIWYSNIVRIEGGNLHLLWSFASFLSFFLDAWTKPFLPTGMFINPEKQLLPNQFLPVLLPFLQGFENGKTL